MKNRTGGKLKELTNIPLVNLNLLVAYSSYQRLKSEENTRVKTIKCLENVIIFPVRDG